MPMQRPLFRKAFRAREQKKGEESLSKQRTLHRHAPVLTPPRTEVNEPSLRFRGLGSHRRWCSPRLTTRTTPEWGMSQFHQNTTRLLAVLRESLQPSLHRL